MKSSLISGCSSRCFKAAKLAPTAAALALLAFASGVRAQASAPPVLPSPLCDSLQIPEGNTLTFHAYAIGVQIYRWDGTTWVFRAPLAVLYADPGYHGLVATHYAGPTWETKSGSKVVGLRLAGCTPDSTAIPWLKLTAVSANGPGVLHDVTYIHRVKTTGGIAPSTPGSAVGEEAEVAYTAVYIFYCAK